jgi:hypothetical protein
MRTGTTLRVGTAVLAGLLSAGLAGCSGSDPKPGTLTPTPTASSTTASRSPSATTPEQQIEAAVRAYYAELTTAVRTSDAAKLEAMTSRDCPCRRPVSVIKANARKGYSAPEASFSASSLQVHDVEPRVAGALITTDEAAYDVLDTSGKVVGSVPARHHQLDLTLVLNENRWIIANVIDLSE